MLLSMLSKKPNITTQEIKYTEKIILPKGEIFNTERRDFIKNLNTVDLQAVPGSGKTAALLAKLLILEKHMPFDDGSGVLVISHTNIAVDEIKKKIKRYCPKLFAYPNFVGTIQSFIDQFLAVPFYVNKFKKRPYRIDDEIYNEKAEKAYDFLSWRTRGYIEKKCGITKKDTKNQKENKKKSFFTSLRFDNEQNLIKGSDGNIFLKSSSNSDSYKDIKKQKCKLLKNGYLCFDDTYFLANKYLQEFPQIKGLIQRRFRFVFVDEMQDMNGAQYAILEKLFYKKDILNHCYQRIGDKNQAIYSNNTKLEALWSDFGRKILELKGSHRLTPKIAKVVECFGLNCQEIKGLRKNCNIKPYIIVFEDPKDVLLKFTSLIKEKGLTDEKHPFCAIGWIGDHRHGNRETSSGKSKLTIKCYYGDFEKKHHKAKIDYPYLRDHLRYFAKKNNSLNPIRKNILNAFLKVLRIENIKDKNDRYYTIREFTNYLRDKKDNFEKYNELKLKLFEWCFAIKKGENVYDELKTYIQSFLLDIFPAISFSQETKDFINLSKFPTIEHRSTDTSCEKDNFFEGNDVKVKIGTVHSVKGETHTATLYMETFYERGDHYESKRLRPQINGEKVLSSDKYMSSKDFTKNLIKKSAKITYVGFSRPTHLLCFAVHKERIDIDFNSDDWQVVGLNNRSSSAKQLRLSLTS